ncbi:unnamed protein product [Pleuronectes platessa]|uniref:Uncharacterized protein n=1 Tax=Pleuronectes platessa TaxID=8262 RepID=A0A9N7UJB8_PLEPL|nr:unnamed protein product [Pleuronectes platessa]
MCQNSGGKQGKYQSPSQPPVQVPRNLSRSPASAAATAVLLALLMAIVMNEDLCSSFFIGRPGAGRWIGHYFFSAIRTAQTLGAGLAEQKAYILSSLWRRKEEEVEGHTLPRYWPPAVPPSNPAPLPGDEWWYLLKPLWIPAICHSCCLALTATLIDNEPRALAICGRKGPLPTISTHHYFIPFLLLQCATTTTPLLRRLHPSLNLPPPSNLALSSCALS